MARHRDHSAGAGCAAFGAPATAGLPRRVVARADRDGRWTGRRDRPRRVVDDGFPRPPGTADAHRARRLRAARRTGLPLRRDRRGRRAFRGLVPPSAPSSPAPRLRSAPSQHRRAPGGRIGGAPIPGDHVRWRCRRAAGHVVTGHRRHQRRWRNRARRDAPRQRAPSASPGTSATWPRGSGPIRSSCRAR